MNPQFPKFPMCKQKIFTWGKMALFLLADAGKLTLETLSEMADYRRRSWRKLLEGSEQFMQMPKRKTLSVILWRLQKQGFVAREGRYWRLTSTGKKAARQIALPRPLPPKDGRRRIIVFDIPEAEKHKRGWLRRELVAYGYESLQKSVWHGMRPLPKRFFEEAEDIAILSYIHIFEITAGGTLDNGAG